MSLRTLFVLMGLVTTAMIAAVIYTKVILPPSKRTLTVGEQRALDRICDIHCADDAPQLAKQARSSDELIELAHACVEHCRTHYGHPENATLP